MNTQIFREFWKKKFVKLSLGNVLRRLLITPQLQPGIPFFLDTPSGRSTRRE